MPSTQGIGQLLSGRASGGGVVAVGGGVAALAWVSRNYRWIALGLGVVVLGLVLLAFFEYLRWQRSRKSAHLAASLKGDVGSKFQSGMEVFRKTGKNLYDIPWYLMVGEPGAGKTYAIRHSNIGFPPGMNDLDAGEGGTAGMDWWFASKAVLLDTAGALLTDRDKADEFQDFLQRIRRNRPSVPINGMVLAIPALSLLTDSDDALKEKAELIAQQFEFIQRILSIRFPVYVIITKSDTIDGFREYFYNFSDTSLPNQIFGWSNPSSLNAPFEADQVEKYLETLIATVKKRRSFLLTDPKTPEDRPRRIDKVDSLYAFPEQLARLGSKLRTYLETVFMPSDWSANPLFLRGIYFTSAVREGPPLDSDLANALGVSPAELPAEKRVWEKNKSYFLKDLFIEKIFREKGLVTSSTTKNPDQRLRGQKIAVLSAGFAACVAVGVFTVFGYLKLDQSVGKYEDFWDKQIKWDAEGNPNVDSLRWSSADGDDSIKLPIFRENLSLCKTKVGDSVVFAIPASFLGDVDTDRKLAHRLIYERCFVQPLFEQSRDKLEENPSCYWPQTAVHEPANSDAAQSIGLDGLHQIIVLEAWLSKTQGNISDPEKSKPDLKALFSLLRFDGTAKRDLGNDPWYQVAQESWDYFCSGDSKSGVWNPAGIWRDGGPRFAQAANSAIVALELYAEQTSMVPIQQLDDLIGSLNEFETREQAFLHSPAGAVSDPKSQLNSWTQFSGSVDALTKKLDPSLKLQPQLTPKGGGNSLWSVYSGCRNQANQTAAWLSDSLAYTGVNGTSSSNDVAGQDVRSIAKQIELQLQTLKDKQAKSRYSDQQGMLETLDRDLLGPRSAETANWEFEIRDAWYAQTLAFLGNPVHIATTTMSQLPKAVKKIQDERAKTIKNLNTNWASDAPSVDKSANVVCQAAVDGWANQSLVRLFASALPDPSPTAETWAQIVGEQAIDTTQAPVLYNDPLADDENPFQNKYNSQAVKGVIQCWSDLVAAEPSSTELPPSDNDDLQSRIRRYQESLTKFLRNYAHAWESALRIRPGQALVGEIKAPKGADLSADINGALKILGRQVDGALSPLSADNSPNWLASPINVEQDATKAGEEALTGDVLPGRTKKLVQIWEAIDGSGSVRDAAINKLSPEAWNVLESPGKDLSGNDYASDYWLAAARVLKEDFRQKCEAEVADRKASIAEMKFPIRFGADQTTEASQEDLTNCDAILKSLTAQVPDDHPLKDALTSLPTDEVARLKRMLDWVEFLEDPNAQCKISLAKDNDGNIPPGLTDEISKDVGFLRDQLNYVSFGPGAKTQTIDDPVTAPTRLRGGQIKLQFYANLNDADNGNVAVSLTESGGPWHILELARQQRNKGIGVNGGSCYFVKLHSPGDALKPINKFDVWLKVEFDRAVFDE